MPASSVTPGMANRSPFLDLVIISLGLFCIFIVERWVARRGMRPFEKLVDKWTTVLVIIVSSLVLLIIYLIN
jgi:hypothetical protein